MITKRHTMEKAMKATFLCIAFFSVTILFFIMFFLFKEGIPIFKTVLIKNFIFGKFWYPTSDPPDFGILSMIVASLAVSLLSGLISMPMGIMTAIYLAEIAPKRTKEIFKPVIELMASLPSVVIGFFGMVIFASFLQDFFDIPTGLNLFNAAIMLAFMAIPTICSLSEDAISNVDDTLREASMALGATKFQTIAKVVLPASLSGICTGVILGLSRAVGETMVVLMVAGGAAIVPQSIFDPVRPMPASIAAEMAEAPFGSEHYHALFATGIVLFVLTLIFNIIADFISNRYT